MARLSKENAKKLVEFLTKKKELEIKEAKIELGIFLSTLVEKRIPDNLRKISELYPNYFSKSNQIQVSGPGFNYRVFQVKNYYIKSNESWGYIQLVVTTKESLELSRFDNKVEKLKKLKTELETDLTNLIFSLGTAKRIIETIPGSKEFLEKLLSLKLVPVVNKDVSSILNRLK